MSGKAMARYYFDIDDSVQKTVDEEGTELGSASAARIEALALLPNIARDVEPDGNERRFLVKIRNDSGAPIFEASLTISAAWTDGER